MSPSFMSTLTGSFSTPAGENPTVVMMEAAYRAAGVDARYLNCDVDAAHLADAVAGARAMGWVGFNCSLPHKVAVIELLDGLGESATAIGAVNCVVRQGDRLIGENTDGKGFVEALRVVRDPAGASVMVLGAGGAARAIAVETALAGAARVTVAARRVEQARDVAQAAAGAAAGAAPACEVDAVAWDGPFEVPAGTSILVNATNIGLHPGGDDLVPVDLDSIAALGGSLLVADVIPNPPQTALLREAAALGAQTLDGLGMLVAQGAVAVQLWTGVAPDRDVMRSALSEALGL